MTKIQTPAPTRADELAQAFTVLLAADMAPEMHADRITANVWGYSTCGNVRQHVRFPETVRSLRAAINLVHACN